MSTENNNYIVGDVFQLVDKDGTAIAQVIDNKFVMHHLMTHIDRRAKYFQCPIDNINGAIDTGTKAAWVCQLDFHQWTFSGATLIIFT